MSYAEREQVGRSQLVSGSVLLVSGSVAPDTIYLRETEIEYRYKLLRDTVRIVRRDSIPYPVTVIETKEVRHIPWWSKALSTLGALCLIFFVGRGRFGKV